MPAARPLSRPVTRHRRRVFLPFLALALSAGLALTACGTGSRAAAPASQTTAPGYPVTVDNCGTRVTIDKPPSRIVTIKSSTLELALALGLQDRIVGTAFRDGPVPAAWSDAAAKLPVLSDNAPSQEAVLQRRPDIIFAGWESNLTAQTAGDRSALADLGVATYVAPSACEEAKYQPHPMTFDLLWKQIDQAGKVFGVPKRAKALVAEQKKSLRAVRPSTAGHTALWYSSGSKTPFVGAGIGAPNMIMQAAGLHNVAAGIDKTWTSMGWEKILAEDPDVIVLVDASWNTAKSKIKQLQDNPATAKLTAVRKHRFVTVPFPASEAGVRNVAAVRSIISQLRTLDR
ncbi:putative F420-0 ABC transporter substrate-binding protein [Flexivirga sp. B27]